RLEIALDIEPRFLEERADDADRRAGEENRVAVGLRAGDYPRSDDSACARTVVHDHLLAESLRELIRQKPADQTGRAARREAHDQADRALRIAALRRSCVREERQAANGGQPHFPAA